MKSAKNRTGKRKTNSSKRSEEKVTNYVMYGFNRDDIFSVGYLGKKSGNPDHRSIEIVDDIEDALLFPDRNVNHVKGFGTPEQWLEFWNSSDEHTFKFHLVKTTL